MSWGRAILLQIAHPLVAAGVAQHSDFGTDDRANRARLWRTVGSMQDLVFGPEEARQAAAARVNAIHDWVHGELPLAHGRWPAGTAYSAHDPALLRWVHVTFVDSALVFHERFVGPLNEAQADRYCAEATAVGPLLGLAADVLPTSRAAVTAAIEAAIADGVLEVGATARELAHHLLHTSPAPGVRGPLRSLLHLPTVGLLPAAVRAAYGLPWTRPHQIGLAGMAAISRLLLPAVPPPLRYWPAARNARVNLR